jgi:addiction module HigA family antidote
VVINETGTDAIIDPGEILEEELAARGMTHKDLAQRMGRLVQTINEVIRGKRALAAETALDLERVLGIEPGLWVRLEGHYRLAVARRKLSRTS